MGIFDRGIIRKRSCPGKGGGIEIPLLTADPDPTGAWDHRFGSSEEAVPPTDIVVPHEEYNLQTKVAHTGDDWPGI